MTDPRSADQIALLRDELSDIDAQVAAGDLDEATADALRAKYTAELESLESAAPDIDDRVGDSTDTEPVSTASPRPRISGRMLAGAAVLGAAIVAIGVLAVVSLDEGTGGAEGVAGDVLADGAAQDLSDISNEEMEAVIEANPEVVGMRLALARRYFEEGSFDRALDHYFEVLEREQHPEALANIGWMTYLSQRPDIALGYLEAALERRPDYLPAQWFISNVLVTLGRNGEAIPLLVGLVESDDVPDEIRSNALDLLEQIESSP